METNSGIEMDSEIIEVPADIPPTTEVAGEIVEIHPVGVRTLCSGSVLWNPQKKKLRERLAQLRGIMVIFVCVATIILDPVFLFLPYVKKGDLCVDIREPAVLYYFSIRSFFDFLLLLNIIAKFFEPYVEVSSGKLVKDRKKICIHYLRTDFVLDLCITLPLIQIFMLSTSHAFLLPPLLVVHFYPKLSIVAKKLISRNRFVMNCTAFLLAGQFVGSCWYFFGFLRVSDCLKHACEYSQIDGCSNFIICDKEDRSNDPNWLHWKSHGLSNACFTEGGFSYGVFDKVVTLAAQKNMLHKYMYSTFWGYQQIATMASNLSPSFYWAEIIFVFIISIMGFYLMHRLAHSFLGGFRSRSAVKKLEGQKVLLIADCSPLRGKVDEVSKGESLSAKEALDSCHDYLEKVASLVKHAQRCCGDRADLEAARREVEELKHVAVEREEEVRRLRAQVREAVERARSLEEQVGRMKFLLSTHYLK